MSKRISISYILFAFFIIFSGLSNLIFGLTDRQQLILFIISMIFALGFGISVFVNTITYLKTRKPDDIWKLGFLGWYGFIALLPQFGKSTFAFFAFFSFLLLKKK